MKKGEKVLAMLILVCAFLLIPSASTQASSTKSYSYSYIMPLAKGSCRVGNETTPGVTSADVKSVSWKVSDSSVLVANPNYYSNRIYTNVIFLKKGKADVTRTLTLKNGKKVKTTYKFHIYKKNTWITEDGNRYYYLQDGSYAVDQWINDRYVDTKGQYDKHFKKSSEGILYLKSKGKYAKNEWVKANDGNRYYFDSDQLMVTNKWVDGYYLQKDGKRKSGLVKTSDGWQLEKKTKSGKTSYKKNCWDTLNDKKVYFGSNGLRIKGRWKTIDGKRYYFDSRGYLVTDKWVDDYYVGPDGYRLKNQRVGEYYVDKSGKKYTSRWIDDYYVDSKGKIQKDKWIDGVYVGLDGKKVEDMNLISGTTAMDGACLTGTAKQLDQLVTYAKTKIGTKYLYGGSSDDGYDCCHFVMTCYKEALGITIPDICYSQVSIGVEIDKNNMDEWQVGDLLVRKGNPDGSGGHAMLYIGDGCVIHSTSSGGVQIATVDSVSSFETVRRILYVK